MKNNRGKRIGKRLKDKLNIKVETAFYNEKGNAFNRVTDYPAILFDPGGYIRFDDKDDFEKNPDIVRKTKVYVRGGISRLKGYTKEKKIGIILSEIGIKPPQTIEKSRYNWGGEPESKAHKKLKAYVCKHPELLGLPATVKPGVREYVLPSFDKIDVLFLHNDCYYAVEVKADNANDDDLRRGIFQCVKYRELLRAEQRTKGNIPQAKALLVIKRKLPENLKKEAKLLNVPFVEVAPTTACTRSPKKPAPGDAHVSPK